ncbi:MAG TPA: signal peptidase II [Thermoanaerobaculia bacterium]|nr:signal peptidase II [Thermoanaerobaculia bacterium]
MKSRFLLLPLLVVAVDQWSKWLIERRLELYESTTVIPGFFDIVHVFNTGIAFGLFPSRGELFGTVVLGLLGLVALSIVGVYFTRAAPHHTLLLFALSLIMGGAIGNLIDRLLLGAVTDFFDVYVGSRHWPTFNVADSAISIGIGLLALETLRSPSTQESERSQEERELDGRAA